MPDEVRHTHDVNELFDWIENMTVPGRPQVSAATTINAPEQVPEFAAELTAPGQQAGIQA